MKFGLAALAAFAFATPALAGTTENPFAQDKAILNLQGVDLATADGQQRLAIRVDQAARAVCGDSLAAMPLSAQAKAQECRATVIADVRSQIEARSAMAPAAGRVALSR